MTKLEKISNKITAFDQKTEEMENEYNKLDSEYREALKAEAISDTPDDSRIKKLRNQLRDIEDRLQARSEVRESLESEQEKAFKENRAEVIRAEAEQQRAKVKEIKQAVSDMKKSLKTLFEAAAVYNQNKIYSPFGNFDIEGFIGKSVEEKLNALSFNPDAEINELLTVLYDRFDYLPTAMLSEINKVESENLSRLGV